MSNPRRLLTVDTTAPQLNVAAANKSSSADRLVQSMLKTHESRPDFFEQTIRNNKRKRDLPVATRPSPNKAHPNSPTSPPNTAKKIKRPPLYATLEQRNYLWSPALFTDGFSTDIGRFNSEGKFIYSQSGFYNTSLTPTASQTAEATQISQADTEVGTPFSEAATEVLTPQDAEPTASYKTLST